jgi:hypothetical protein
VGRVDSVHGSTASDDDARYQDANKDDQAVGKAHDASRRGARRATQPKLECMRARVAWNASSFVLGCEAANASARREKRQDEEKKSSWDSQLGYDLTRKPGRSGRYNTLTHRNPMGGRKGPPCAESVRYSYKDTPPLDPWFGSVSHPCAKRGLRWEGLRRTAGRIQNLRETSLQLHSPLERVV